MLDSLPAFVIALFLVALLATVLLALLTIKKKGSKAALPAMIPLAILVLAGTVAIPLIN